jgi:acyl-CoA thioester hydrolase
MVDLILPAGLELTLEAQVEPRFLDAMGHMNVTWYTHLFDRGVWAYFERHGLDAGYMQREGRGAFALEESTHYLAELREGDRLSVHTGLLEVREKTLRLVQIMTAVQKQTQAATREVVAAHIDLRTRRTTPFPPDLAVSLRSQVVSALPDGTLSDAGAHAFARDWIAAWNRGDVEAVLAHYAEDAVFWSPKAERITGRGRVAGKAALRAYWRRALEQSGKLDFSLEMAAWSARAETLTLVYRAAFAGHEPQRTAEIMRFRGSHIVQGEALYGALVGSADQP